MGRARRGLAVTRRRGRAARHHPGPGATTPNGYFVFIDEWWATTFSLNSL
jgi:hypothetical protein